MFNDFWDLQPGEKSIREQKWAEVGGKGAVPEWPEIYQRELQRVGELKDVELPLALDHGLKAGEWMGGDLALQQVWAEKIEKSKTASEPEKRALLREAVAARQTFYASLRQETVYRGKVILLSTASLLAGLSSLIVWFCYFELGILGSSGITHVQGTLLAVLCGWTGGAFTWLVSNRRAVGTSTLAVLREISRWPYTISRGMIGAFAGFVMYAALAANVVTNPTPSLFADRASTEEREKAGEIFRALVASAKPPADVAAKAEAQMLRDLDSRFREVRARSDQEWLQTAGVPLSSGSDATSSAIADSLRRSVNPFWMLVFVCILAGFSETLIPSLLEASVSKLERAMR